MFWENLFCCKLNLYILMLFILHIPVKPQNKQRLYLTHYFILWQISYNFNSHYRQICAYKLEIFQVEKIRRVWLYQVVIRITDNTMGNNGLSICDSSHGNKHASTICWESMSHLKHSSCNYRAFVDMFSLKKGNGSFKICQI